MVKRLSLIAAAVLVAFAFGKALMAGSGERLSPRPPLMNEGGSRSPNSPSSPSHSWEGAGGRALFVVPPFVLTDSNGKEFSSKTLAGKPYIADFIFTRCAGQCPMMTARVQQAAKKLPGMRLVSFSLDPKDSPKVLRAYAAKTGAAWTFLTGKPGAVKKLSIEGFKLAAADGGPANEPISHSKYLVLVDAAGNIRGYYDAMDDASFERLLSDASSPHSWGEAGRGAFPK